MNGIINLLKPPGMTSHDVVAFLRRLLGTKAVGHTGTLDPGVAGVLPVCVGNATRVAEFITNGGKTYRAEITFGITTQTQDSFGEILRQSQVKFGSSEALAVIPRLSGWIDQIPPMVSAIKTNGKRLYQLAREGKEIERKPRHVFIEYIKPIDIGWHKEYPSILFDVSCSKGTYIRALCADWGEMAGCGAHMSYLLRTRSGPYELSSAWTLEELAASVDKGEGVFFLPVDSALAHLPALELKAHRVKPLLNGLTQNPASYWVMDKHPLVPDQWVRLYGPDGNFLALGTVDDSGCIHPKKVFGQQ